MYDFLNEKTTLSIRQINQLIEQLELKGYIDDASLAKSMVNSYRSLLQGKHKVIRNLRKKGIDEEIIQNALSDDVLEDEYENALRFAQKTKAGIKDKSLRALKQNLNQKMALQGFDYEVIESVMNALNFNDEAQAEMDALRKVAIKAKKRYATKHSGTALRNALFTYLDHQGFSLDDIYIVLNEMEF
jgi:1,2-diacylglycerol 3-alpha-glucosyltransferase